MAALSGGSTGRALELADAGGLELYRSLIDCRARRRRSTSASCTP